MARQMSEFRRSIRELAAELVGTEETYEAVAATPAGVVKYRQLFDLRRLPDTRTVRDIVVRAVNSELKTAAIDAAMSVDRRAAELAAMIRAAGIDPTDLLERLAAK